MYESPINVICGKMQTKIEGDTYKAVQNVGIDVNKEELLKALQYDRGQYAKGYSDGYTKSIDDFLKYAFEVFRGDSIGYAQLITIAEQMRGGGAE